MVSRGDTVISFAVSECGPGVHAQVAGASLICEAQRVRRTGAERLYRGDGRNQQVPVHNLRSIQTGSDWAFTLFMDKRRCFYCVAAFSNLGQAVCSRSSSRTQQAHTIPSQHWLLLRAVYLKLQ